MSKLQENVDTASMIVIAITLALFVVALFTKGFTHDLLLEAAVFLVSVTLIMLSYQSAARAQSMENKLEGIYSHLLHAESLLSEGNAER